MSFTFQSWYSWSQLFVVSHVFCVRSESACSLVANMPCVCIMPLCHAHAVGTSLAATRAASSTEPTPLSPRPPHQSPRRSDPIFPHCRSAIQGSRPLAFAFSARYDGNIPYSRATLWFRLAFCSDHSLIIWSRFYFAAHLTAHPNHTSEHVPLVVQSRRANGSPISP